MTDETADRNPNRRLFLAAAVAEQDPIFDIIERHRVAFTAFTRAGNAIDMVRARSEGRVVTDVDEAAFAAAGKEERGIIDALVATQPRTVAGARAAIEYLVEYDDGCVPEACGRFLHILLKSPIIAG